MILLDKFLNPVDSQREFRELLILIQQGFPECRDALPTELCEFWEYRKSMFVFDNVILFQDRVVVPPSLGKFCRHYILPTRGYLVGV